MIARIRRTIHRYSMLEGVRQLGVAVSGGADSVCLLHVLADLAESRGLELKVLHLDHRLRGAESEADAAFVRELAGSLGLGFRESAVDLRKDGNLEQEARRARLAFFAEQMACGLVERVATGHTRTDQAETLLFRFLRGAGSAGLAGIRPVTASGLIRPMIEVDRGEVEEYLRARGIAWREDATNASLDFARNRIRHRLLPQLVREWNPSMVETLGHTADWAVEEEAWWAAEVERLAGIHFTLDRGAVLVEAAALLELPRAAARRLVRRAVELVRGDLRSVGFSHVEAVLGITAEREGGIAKVPGVAVCHSMGQVRFARPERPVAFRFEAPVPGRVAIPGGELWLSLEIVDKPGTTDHSQYVYNSEMGCLDWNRIDGSPELRSWQPGDRYQPVGSPSERKIKDLFQQGRVPAWERSTWPVLEAGGRILWSRRFGPAAWCAAGTETPLILQVSEAPEQQKRNQKQRDGI